MNDYGFIGAVMTLGMTIVLAKRRQTWQSNSVVLVLGVLAWQLCRPLLDGNGILASGLFALSMACILSFGPMAFREAGFLLREHRPRR